MTVKELRKILDSIPYGILTYGDSDYDFNMRIPNSIEINFEYDNLVRCYLIVYTSGNMRKCNYPPINNDISGYENCIQAMHNTKTYLEILGFKLV